MSQKHKSRKRRQLDIQVVKRNKNKAHVETLRDCATPDCKNVVMGHKFCSRCRTK